MQKKQQHLGRYEVAGELRRSTSGIVHQARDPELDRDVAIKTLVVPLDAEPAEAERRRESFLAEAECAGRLQHPAIVVVYETDRDSEPDSPFMAMEFVAGPSLEQLLAGEGALNADWVLGTAETLAEALQAAHADGIFHGDLKPSNILIRESDGAPKIADFGAPRTQLDLRNLTDDDGNARASYLAPEVIQGAAANARTDLFSLALVIYEALSGQHAYEGHDFVSSCGAILDKAPIPIRQRVSDIAPSVEAFLLRALSYEPADRFPDAGAFAAALAGARVAQQHYVAPPRHGVRAETVPEPGTAETTVEPCPADAGSVLELHDPALPPGGDTSPEKLDETPIVPTDTQDLAGGLPVADYKPLELAIGIPDPEPDPAGTADTGFAFDVLEDDAEAAPFAAAEEAEAMAPTGVIDEPTDTAAEPVHSPAPVRGRARPAPRRDAPAGAQPDTPEGSRRWIAVVLALAFLVVVGIIAMALSGGAGDETATTAQVPRTPPAPLPESPAGLQVLDGSVTATAEPAPEIEATPAEPPAPKAAAPKPRRTPAPVETRPAPKKQPAAPAPAEPVLAPVEVVPAATPPPPAVPTHSFLDVAVTSSIKAGTLVLLVDGQPVSTHELTTESGTWARAVKKVKRQVRQEFTARLEISPGRHTLTARIIREKRSRVLEESVQVNLEAGASASVAIDAGKTLGRKLSIDVAE